MTAEARKTTSCVGRTALVRHCVQQCVAFGGQGGDPSLDFIGASRDALVRLAQRGHERGASSDDERGKGSRYQSYGNNHEPGNGPVTATRRHVHRGLLASRRT